MEKERYGNFDPEEAFLGALMRTYEGDYEKEAEEKGLKGREKEKYIEEKLDKFVKLEKRTIAKKKAYPYEEWIEDIAAGTVDYELLKQIEATIGKCYSTPNALEHCYLFLNNYMLEKEILKRYPSLHWYDAEAQGVFSEGKGYAAPDFFSEKTNKTLKLKCRQTVEDAARIPPSTWCHADVHLLYARMSGELYIINDDLTYRKIDKFRAPKFYAPVTQPKEEL